jgi:hypothetical protein
MITNTMGLEYEQLLKTRIYNLLHVMAKRGFWGFTE